MAMVKGVLKGLTWSVQKKNKPIVLFTIHYHLGNIFKLSGVVLTSDLSKTKKKWTKGFHKCIESIQWFDVPVAFVHGVVWNFSHPFVI